MSTSKGSWQSAAVASVLGVVIATLSPHALHLYSHSLRALQCHPYIVESTLKRTDFFAHPPRACVYLAGGRRSRRVRRCVKSRPKPRPRVQPSQPRASLTKRRRGGRGDRRPRAADWSGEQRLGRGRSRAAARTHASALSVVVIDNQHRICISISHFIFIFLATTCASTSYIGSFLKTIGPASRLASVARLAFVRSRSTIE